MQEVTELEERRLAVCKLIKEWQEENSANSDAALARATAISGSTMSQIKRGIYTGDVEKMLAVLENFFEMQRQRLALNPQPAFQQTVNGQRVIRFVNTVHVGRSIGVITGSAGIGKTMALRHYAATTPSAVYIQVNPLHRSSRQFIQTLCMALDLRGSRDTAVAFDRLMTTASTRGTLFILDDMQSLFSGRDASSGGTILELIRALHDGGAAVVISGNRSLSDRVTRTEDEAFYQQFASRAYILAVPDALPREDVGAVAADLLGKAAPDQFIDYLHGVASRYYGSLRLAARILAQAAIRAQAQGGTLTMRHLQDAAKLMASQLKPEFRNQKTGGIVRVEKTAGGDSDAEPEEQRASA